MRFILSLIILCFICTFLVAQPGKPEFSMEDNKEQQEILKVPTLYDFSINRRPPISFNIFADIEYTRNFVLRVNSCAVYDYLQFEKQDRHYIARYQVNTSIRRDEQVQYYDTRDYKLDLEAFDLTNSTDRYDERYFNLKEVKLKPGKYEAWFEILDLNSKKSYRSKRLFTCPGDTAGESRMPVQTEIAFFRDSVITLENIRLASAARILDSGLPYLAVFRMISDTDHPVDFDLRVFKDNPVEELSDLRKVVSVSPDSGIVSVFYKFSADMLPEGEYLIRISSDLQQILVEKKFSVIWFGKPVYLYKSELALQPMKYILSPEEYEYASSLNRERLDQWIFNYWSARDPSPGTGVNELSLEFFQRVHKANTDFSLKNRRGWSTDRGKILILYGEPDEIENRLYSPTKLPHIIWRYKTEQIEFVFVDVNNSDDYILIEEE